MQFVNVNRHNIARNIKADPADRRPVLSVRRTRSGPAQYGNGVGVYDSEGRLVGRFIYDPDRALLKCGARLIFEVADGCEARVE